MGLQNNTRISTIVVPGRLNVFPFLLGTITKVRIECIIVTTMIINSL